MNDNIDPISFQGMPFNYLKKGKVKNVYENGGELLLFDFTDQISVFDKVIPSLIPRKGEALCRGTEYWFKKVHDERICKTHYAMLAAPNQMIVRKADVVEKPTTETDAYFIPAEFICRHYAAGSLIKRMQKGKMKPEEVGLKSIPKEGDKLPEALVEATTKFEKFDRPLSYNEMLELTGLTAVEYENIKETVLKIDEVISREVGQRGLIHVDGKKEFAFDEGRELMLVDSFGTADEDRFWDQKQYEQGNLVQLSKELVRKHYEEIGYQETLDLARDSGFEEPKIPALTPEMITAAAAMYAESFERTTGLVF